MGHHCSCRGCRHAVPPQEGGMGWCRLRELAIHPDLVGELWCHHWTARAPRLPTLATGTMPHRSAAPATRQLSLDAVLAPEG